MIYDARFQIFLRKYQKKKDRFGLKESRVRLPKNFDSYGVEEFDSLKFTTPPESKSSTLFKFRLFLDSRLPTLGVRLQNQSPEL